MVSEKTRNENEEEDENEAILSALDTLTEAVFGCILTLSLVGGPEFVPMVIAAGFIKCAEIAKT